MAAAPKALVPPGLALLWGKRLPDGAVCGLVDFSGEAQAVMRGHKRERETDAHICHCRVCGLGQSFWRAAWHVPTRLQSWETPVAVTPLLRRSPEGNGHKWLPVFMGTAVHPAATDTVHLIKSELFKYLMINDQGSTF